MKNSFYNDGITRYTDPFWTIKCKECGHASWSLTHMDNCPKCKSLNTMCTNPAIKKA